MTDLKRYRSPVADSIRWNGFVFRDDDVVICTPPKCGTTWMQMLCAMLLFDTVEFDRPLSQISPWLDMQTRSRADVVAALDAQPHRRVIKTHTPLDGLPLDDRVTYVCVGRDPRDAALSLDAHRANLNQDAFLAARAAAVGLDDLAELGPPPGPPPEDPVARFWTWAQGSPGSNWGHTLAEILHHMQTFWDHRADANVALFHYSDLLADLPGQLRRLAEVLDVEVSDGRLRDFAAAATFQRMKQRADRLAPEADLGIWFSNNDFFHRGHDGQWRELLDTEAQRRYRLRVGQLVSPELAAWAHGGWSAVPASSPR
jgi:aryl sulfotransferase